jgi:hypothetical protein
MGLGVLVFQLLELEERRCEEPQLPEIEPWSEAEDVGGGQLAGPEDEQVRGLRRHG